MKGGTQQRDLSLSRACSLTSGLWFEFISGVGIACLADLGRSEMGSSQQAHWRTRLWWRRSGLCKLWLFAGGWVAVDGQSITSWGKKERHQYVRHRGVCSLITALDIFGKNPRSVERQGLVLCCDLQEHQNYVPFPGLISLSLYEMEMKIPELCLMQKRKTFLYCHFLPMGFCASSPIYRQMLSGKEAFASKHLLLALIFGSMHLIRGELFTEFSTTLNSSPQQLKHG